MYTHKALLATIMVVINIFIAPNLSAKNDEVEKKLDNADLLKSLEQFVLLSSETDGNFTTLSFRNWKTEIGRTLPWGPDELLRKMSDAFDRKNPKLQIIFITPLYTSKSSGGLECYAIFIYHQPRNAQSMRR
jgi:hypothetical protein